MGRRADSAGRTLYVPPKMRRSWILCLAAGSSFGVAPGASPEHLEALGYENTNARERFNAGLPILRHALAGKLLGASDKVLQPLAPGLEDRMWQATFSVNGATRAAKAGDGLMLSRIQPGTEVGELVGDRQMPIIETYRDKLAAGVEPRILASRTAVVIDAELLRYTGTYFGTVDEVTEQLAQDKAAAASTEVSFQVHSLDPGHELTMRSLELLGTQVAPALGWTVADV